MQIRKIGPDRRERTMKRLLSKDLRGPLLVATLCGSLGPCWAQTPIVVGLAESAGFIGTQERIGASLARDQINSNGGIHGRLVEIVVLDDKCSARHAVDVANKFVYDLQVTAVVGHICDSASEAVKPIYQREDVLFFSLSDLPALTTQARSGIFRLCGRTDRQAEIVARYLHSTFGSRPVGGIFQSSSAGDALGTVADSIISFQFDERVQDLDGARSLAGQLASTDIDAVMIAGTSVPVAIEILRTSLQYGLSIEYIFDTVAAYPAFLDFARSHRANALFVSTCYAPVVDDELVTAVGTRFSSSDVQVQVDYVGIALHVAAAVEILAAAVTATDSLDYDKLVQIVHARSFDTAIGQLQFDGNGDVDADMDDMGFTRQYLYQWFMIEDGTAKRWTKANPCK